MRVACSGRPKPRVNLIRLHGVFAPNSRHRAFVTPAKRGKGNHASAPDAAQEQTPPEPHAAMSLKRVFHIDIQTCQGCGGTVRIIACIRLQGGRRYESRDGRGRAKQEARAESDAGAKAERIGRDCADPHAPRQPKRYRTSPAVTALSSATPGAVALSPQTPHRQPQWLLRTGRRQSTVRSQGRHRCARQRAAGETPPGWRYSARPLGHPEHALSTNR